MPRHIDAWMDGVALESLGGVILQAVSEDAPGMELTTGARPGRSGTRLLVRKRTELQVSMQVAIRERFDLGRRTAIIQALAAWADGSVLEMSNHPGQRLHVKCTSFAAPGEVRNWAEPVRIGVTAYEIPFWEDSVPSSWTASGSTATETLHVTGTAPAPVDVTLSPTADTLTGFSLTVAGQTLTLAGLSVGTSASVVIDHDALDLIRIRTGTTSLLDKRTGADDLIATPGACAVSYTASTACSLTLTVRGRWL